MSRFTPLFIALFLFILLCGCGGGSESTPTGATGFRGVVREKLGSGEIVPIPNATVLIAEWYGDSEQITGGPEIARTTTDAEGRFSFAVPAGWYVIASPFLLKYADGCRTPSPIWVEKIPAGKVSEGAITQTECR